MPFSKQWILHKSTTISQFLVWRQMILECPTSSGMAFTKCSKVGVCVTRAASLFPRAPWTFMVLQSSAIVQPFSHASTLMNLPSEMGAWTAKIRMLANIYLSPNAHRVCTHYQHLSYGKASRLGGLPIIHRPGQYIGSNNRTRMTPVAAAAWAYH